MIMKKHQPISKFRGISIFVFKPLKLISWQVSCKKDNLEIKNT